MHGDMVAGGPHLASNGGGCGRCCLLAVMVAVMVMVLGQGYGCGRGYFLRAAGCREGYRRLAKYGKGKYIEFEG